MKAAVVTRYGPPGVLEIRDVLAPVPADDELHVRLHASTVCYGDRIIRQGPLFVRLFNGIRRPKASILGADIAGTVVSVGRNVTRFAPGDQCSDRAARSSAAMPSSPASPRMGS